MKTLELKAGSPSGSSWKSPLQKLAKFFERSRDRWKAKYFAKKEQYKLMGNQARAVEKSRAKWREMAELAQTQVRELQQELEQYKKPSSRDPGDIRFRRLGSFARPQPRPSA